jgi:hypothetical protein
VFALAGRASDTHGTRILGSLDPAVEAFKSVSRGFLEWTWNRRGGAGVAVSLRRPGAAAVLLSRRSAAPILLSRRRRAGVVGAGSSLGGA